MPNAVTAPISEPSCAPHLAALSVRFPPVAFVTLARSRKAASQDISGSATEIERWAPHPGTVQTLPLGTALRLYGFELPGDLVQGGSA
jgi:hypothetical protein